MNDVFPDWLKSIMLASFTASLLLITGTVQFDYWPWSGNYTISAYVSDSNSQHQYVLTHLEGGDIQNFYIDGSSAFGFISKDRRNSRNCGYSGENKICVWYK